MQTATSAVAFNGPLFLVGMPRSGTKLLRELLNGHPLVAIPDIETEFLPWLVNRVARSGDLSEFSRFESFYCEITKLPYFLFRREAGKLIDARSWHAACMDFSAAGIFEALLRLEVGAPPGSPVIWGDKSPSYIGQIALLERLYPQCRVLHIVRDVRDYCLSIQKAWGKNMMRAAQRWVDGVECARATAASLGDAYLEVRYEDLLSDPERTVSRVCLFLGIDFRTEMLSLRKATENRGDTKGLSWIVRDNFEKYASRMDRRQLQAIEAIAGRTLLNCGYRLALEPQAPRRLSKAQLLAAQLGDAWNLVRTARARRGLLGALRFHFRYFLSTRG